MSLWGEAWDFEILRYMAPEVYPPTLHAGIPSNDVWAMGVTLFQLLVVLNSLYEEIAVAPLMLHKGNLHYYSENRWT